MPQPTIDLQVSAASPCPPTMLTRPLTLLFAAAIGVMVINLFAAQPLTGPIADALALPPAWRGLVPMVPQLGYALGLVLVVPLADRFENRRLVMTTLLLCAGMLALAAAARSGPMFLLSAGAAGAASCAIQMLVPLAASMAPEAQRGRAVGNVMSGLMVGVLLSRPMASLLAGAGGWRVCYAALSAMDLALVVVLLRWLPRQQPGAGHTYARLIGSMWHLLRDQPVLRRHALTAGLTMGAFSAFWTAVGLRLVQAPFSLDSRGLALFALAGASGAVVAPLAGRAGDRGHTSSGTLVSHVVILAALALAWIGGMNGSGLSRPMALAALVVAAALIDAGVTADQTLGRREINLLDPAARGRLNGLFVGIFFVGGALGALAGGLGWAAAQWQGACAAGTGFVIAALLVHGGYARRG